MGILTSQEIGGRLREFRKRRGLTQEQLAVMVDVTFQQIQKYENGFTRLNTDKLQAVAQALDVPVAAFFDDKEGNERLLSPQELSLVEGFRALSSQDKRDFVLDSLSKTPEMHK
jgi:transcriptional regulator with XRE-family HTH domain